MARLRDPKSLDDIAARLDKFGARARGYYKAPMAEVRVEYPKGFGPYGEDEYTIRDWGGVTGRGFGLKRAGYGPGTRARASLEGLVKRVSDNGGTVVVGKMEVVLVRDRARTINRRRSRKRKGNR